MSSTKICSQCKLEKDIEEFHKDKSKIDGRRHQCKSCRALQMKKYYSTNREEIKDKALKYREENREVLREKAVDYYHKNQNKILLQKKDYHEKNRDRLIKKMKQYKESNPEKIKKLSKRYYENNKETILRKNKSFRDANKEKIYAKQKEYRIKNKEKINKRQKKYAERKCLFSTYAQRLTITESPREDRKGYMLVKCAYCDQYFYPKIKDVQTRIKAVEGKMSGEIRLYCSHNCKISCPIYRKVIHQGKYRAATSREVQPELRKMRLALDNYQCQKCGASIEDSPLHCHHYTGTMQNPIESADLDNTITLCKVCHKWVHTQEGCRYFELRCGKKRAQQSH